MTGSDYTNLKETYLYGKVSDRLKFYKYYKNNENSIDDPIFTGFTFDVDTLHSPLFFMGQGYEDAASDTLRSVSGSDTRLSEIIESRLDEMYKYSVVGAPDSYELNTISVKDLISLDSRRSGYGLQDKHYIDNVLYGAVDYIYMTDKVSDSAYTDELGRSDVGNGTPTNSVYDEYNKTINQAYSEFIADKKKELESEDLNIPVGTYDENTGLEFIEGADIVPDGLDPDVNTYPITEILKKRRNELESEEVKNERIENEDKFNELKREVESLKNPEGQESYDDLKVRKDELESAASSETADVKSDLSNMQDKVSSLLSRLKSSLDVDGDDAREINKMYEDYQTFYDDIEKNYPHISVGLSPQSRNRNFSEQEQNLSDVEKERGEALLEVYRKAWEIMNAKVESITQSDTLKSELSQVKNELSRRDSAIYGEGRTELNPDPDSPCGKRDAAEEIMNNDRYHQLTGQIEALEDAGRNYYDALQYKEYNKDKTSTMTTFPTMDPRGKDETDESYNARLGAYQTQVNSMRTSRKTYEVPQTVYDMIGFISGMKRMTTEYPYIMKSISGLDAAYSKYFKTGEPYLGSGDDKISIDCYESLDMRVSSMLNKYLNAAYDHQYKRERLPVNLRRFNCSVFVHDIRNFRNALGLGDDKFREMKDGDSTVSKIVEIALNYVSAVEFKFFDCEIVPEETGVVFDNVSNESAGDMRSTKFTFTYGNCVINFLPFEDLKKYYVSGQGEVREKPGILGELGNNADSTESISGTLEGNVEYNSDFRRWFDRSPLGNVNNNDYRDYVRKDSSVAVDDLYKSTIVNDFAMNSVVNKNKELTAMDDALRQILVGVSASTGIPAKGVADALNIGNIYDYINKGDGSELPPVRKIGNVSNMKIIDGKTTEYIGVVQGSESTEKPVTDLGKAFNPDGGYDMITDLGNVNANGVN